MSKSLGKNLRDVLEKVNFIRDNAVFKEDLKQFATKEDLEQFATKKDLEQFATKGDLFLLREELLGIIKELPSKEDFSDLLSSVDNYAKKVDTYFMETLSLKSQFNRFQVSLAK